MESRFVIPNEIVFLRSNRTIAIVLVLFLLLQVLFGIIQMGQFFRGSWTDVAFIEFILASPCVLMLFPFVMQRFIRFYPTGISYVRLFSRRFIKWGDITAISNVSLNQHPVLRLVAGSNTVNIMLSEFLNPEEVVKFIDLHLNAINHDGVNKDTS